MNSGTEIYFQENKPHAGLGRASLHSGAITIVARGVSIASQVLSMVVLGRLLSPNDFGLTAIIFAIIGFGPMLIDLGTSEASSQKTHITKEEVSTLFWLNAAIGLALAVLLAFGGRFIAELYDQPALAEIAPVVSLIFIAAGISTQHTALLRRTMQFRSLALIDITANALGSLVGIAMALTGWGYWALVAKPVSTAIFTMLGVWNSCRWIPAAPQDSAAARHSIRFGLGVAGFTVTDYFAKSTDRMALGYFYGTAPLGYYQNAFLFFSNFLSLLSEPLHNIAVSSLSKLRGNLDEFKRSWAMALSSVTFLAALAYSLLAVTGPDLIVILFGPKWVPAGPLLCVFAIRGIAQTAERSMGWLHVSAGRSERWMRWGLLNAVFQLLAVVAGLPFGPMGVAISCTLTVYIMFIPALVYAGRPVGIGMRDVIRATGPQIVAGLLTVALGLAFRHLLLADLSVYARFVISGLMGVLLYFLFAVLAFGITDPLRLGISVGRDLISKFARNS